MTQPPPAKSSLTVRFGFVAIFIVFGGLGVAVAASEWAQLFTVLSRPYHHGDPPSALALALSAAGACSAVWILFRFARSGRGSLPAAGVVLVCALGCWIWGFFSEPKGRSWAAPDKQIVNVGSALRERMVQVLQNDGKAPADATAWEKGLAAVAQGLPSPVKDRQLRNVPFTIVLVAEPGANPATLVPGSLLVWISADGTKFEITPVGFGKDGAVAVLWDDSGEALVLRSGYAPALSFATDKRDRP